MALSQTEKRARDRAYRAKHKVRFKEKRIWLKEHYGITPAQYDETLLVQGYKCCICLREHKDSKYKKLTVDHNHTTKKVRALLCRHCNLMLGFAEDKVDTLLRAAEYIKEHNV